jgi:hypothetical protein
VGALVATLFSIKGQRTYGKLQAPAKQRVLEDNNNEVSWLHTRLTSKTQPKEG